MINYFYFFCFLFSHIFLQIKCSDLDNVIQVDINSASPDSPKYSLKLSKPDDFVLHPSIKVISLTDTNENSGDQQQKKLVAANIWTPSNADLNAAQDNLYIDKENFAAVRLAWDENKKEHFAVSGVVNGNKIEEGMTLSNGPPQGNRSDYIDVGRKITPSKARQSSSTPLIVETLVVVDKEFGDIFNHDRQRILDYFTVYFWDINMRYKTLPNSNIAFQITGIVIINSYSGQPFIEEAREKDGRAEFGRILWRFGKWVFNQQDSLPKFDIAVAITNTQLEWGGGLAYYRTACHKGSDIFLSTTVWNDDGAWGSLTVGAHEIGHVLGAPHDDDPNQPGGCEDRGYIMAGATDELRWFFSTCTDRQIGDFVRSNEASCLKRQDERQAPAIPSDFSNVLAPNMEDQCKRRLKRSDAFVPDEEKGNCLVMKCWVPEDGYWLIWSMAPVDNTICGDDRRCFRGRCRKNGNILMNVGTGQCAKARDPFNHMTPIEMITCPNPTRGATPLDKFIVEESSSNGRFFMTPWNTPNGKENGDKCIYTGNGEGDGLWTDKCDLNNPWQGWNFINLGGRNREFMLSHRVTERCAKQEGSWIQSYKNCNRNDRNMRWRLL